MMFSISITHKDEGEVVDEEEDKGNALGANVELGAVTAAQRTEGQK
jgi:hypothetical protein